MNRLAGCISAIDSAGHLSIVDIEIAGGACTAIVMETPATAEYLRVGAPVAVLFKETEVSLAKDLAGQISLRNRFRATVRAIDKGRVLTRVALDYAGGPITSIITTRSVDKLALRVGDEVEGLVKANEVSLLQGAPP